MIILLQISSQIMLYAKNVNSLYLLESIGQYLVHIGVTEMYNKK